MNNDTCLIERSAVRSLIISSAHTNNEAATDLLADVDKLPIVTMADAADVLRDCLDAFEAMGTAAKARKLLKKWGQVPGAYAGSGQNLLAEYMIKKLRDSAPLKVD